MSLTAVPNLPAISLQPTAPVSQPSPLLNPQFMACDPFNGNYFSTTNRDLVTFACLPSASAPLWSAVVTYTVGQVVNVPVGSPAVLTPYIAIFNASANLNQNPTTSPTFWAAYSGSMLYVASAPDGCTGRTANIGSVTPNGTGFTVTTGYPLPVFDAAQQSVEFLVLPSSVFTQANGQFQFQASSNLAYVYVRNL